MSKQIKEPLNTREADKIITVSNLISLFRAFLALPIIYFLKTGDMENALIVIIVAIITDLLDGWIARVANSITHLGKILDPFADKVVIFSVMIYMVLEVEEFPLWFLVFLMSRDFIISVLGMTMLNKRKVSPMANKMGKVSIVFTSAVILSYLYSGQYFSVNINQPLLYTTVAFQIISLIQYVVTYVNIIHKGEAACKKPGKQGTSKLSLGLAKTEIGIAARLPLIRKFFKVDEDVLGQIEETLLTADMGVDLTEKLIEKLRKVNKTEETELKEILKEEMKKLIHHSPSEKEETIKPSVIFFIGINGTGKTTTIGKLANKFKNEGKNILLAAADTFRAAAYEQLEVWAQRAGVDFAGASDATDPAAIAFDAVRRAIDEKKDILLVDTAGRLHTKSNLMEELKKVKRVVDKALPGAPHEIWLVIDANIGQNGIVQAQKFMEAVGVTGLILTKLDGTAKGGAVLAIHDQLNIPIKYLGVGEKLDDILEFEPTAFIDELLS
ncbi:MAG: signal recognition particle-docking protein FtsY [Candidatus Marinimicrobia bacterium]|nr:signal recognition particle-docking protein FtsY [Candidatus Neomarinimicrobiota bacterium]